MDFLSREELQELQILADEAGFEDVDELDLFDIVFGACECCCKSSGGSQGYGPC